MTVFTSCICMYLNDIMLLSEPCFRHGCELCDAFYHLAVLGVHVPEWNIMAAAIATVYSSHVDASYV